MDLCVQKTLEVPHVTIYPRRKFSFLLSFDFSSSIWGGGFQPLYRSFLILNLTTKLLLLYKKFSYRFCYYDHLEWGLVGIILSSCLGTTLKHQIKKERKCFITYISHLSIRYTETLVNLTGVTLSSSLKKITSC